MSVTVVIGPESRPLEAAHASWIQEQIAGRRAAGQRLCVRVVIMEFPIELNLATPTCGSGGGSRELRPAEREVIDFWRRLRLDQLDFQPRDVVAFVRYLDRMFRHAA